MNPEQLKAALRSAGYLVMSEGGGGYGTEPGDPYAPGKVSYYYVGPRGRASVAEVAAATGVPELALENAKPSMEATPEESASLYPSRGGGGFFSHLAGLVTSPSFALAASVVAPSILAAEAAGAAALASGAEGLAVPAAAPPTAAPAAAAAPAATAFPVATSPLAAPSVLASDTLGASLSGLTSEQIAAATSANALAPTTAGANAVNALAPVFDPASALETQLTAAPSTAVTPVFDPASAMETQLTATGTPAAVSPAAVSPAAVTPATTNALAPTFDPASAMETQLTATPDVTGLPSGAFDALAKFAKDYGVPLASLISGITGSQAAQSAAETQARSAAEARQLARDIFNEQKALQEPFRTAGITAQNQLLTLLGLPGGTQGAEYGKYARPFGMQDFQADPGYAFRLSEGMKALEASRAAKGGLLSGATGKALSRYGQDLASQEYGNAFNRFQTERVNRLQPLGALMGTGQAAAAGQAGYAGQYGQTAGGLTTDIGAVRAAGDIGAARAISNALSAYGNYMGNQNLAQAIRESQYNR